MFRVIFAEFSSLRFIFQGLLHITCEHCALSPFPHWGVFLFLSKLGEDPSQHIFSDLVHLPCFLPFFLFCPLTFTGALPSAQVLALPWLPNPCPGQGGVALFWSRIGADPFSQVGEEPFAQTLTPRGWRIRNAFIISGSSYHLYLGCCIEQLIQDTHTLCSL